MINSTNILTTGAYSEHSSLQESYEDYFDQRIPKWVALLIFVVGLFGNSLSLLIFCQKNMRKNSTFIYLAFLCIVDIFVILFGLGDVLLISYLKVIVRNQSILVCRLHTFLTYLFTHLSSFILASVSIERAIATNFINHAKRYCRPKTAYKVLLINVLIAVAINFHSLLFLGYEQIAVSSDDLTFESSDFLFFRNNSAARAPLEETKNFFCASKENTLYDRFLDPYFQWIDLVFYALLPFFIMAISSFFIIKVIFLSHKRLVKSNTSTPASSLLRKNQESQENQVKNNENSRSLSLRILKTFSRRNKSTNSSTSKLNKKLHLTYTLISINVLFFILVSPLVILSILYNDKESIQNKKILFNIIYLLAYSNHSLNFIFYGLSSPPYRETLLKLLRLKKKVELITKTYHNQDS